MANLLSIYERVITLGEPFLEKILANRLERGKEDSVRLSERKGIPSRPRPSGHLIWIHAASVGEAQSTLILIDAMEKLNDGAINVLVTTGTVTSATLMERRLPSFAFHQYIPLDHPAWVATFLDHWKPDLALWMESELWPNMLRGIKARHITAALVNARLSKKSYALWRMGKAAVTPLLSTFSMVLAQTEKDADRFRALGARNVKNADNIKYSAAPLPYDDMALSTLRVATDNRKIWVYASTHEGEEALACRIHKRIKQHWPDLLTIIVPRHPERRDDVAAICFEHGVKYTLRSNALAMPSPDDDIYIADTLGELGLFYSLCPIAMIGRSFSKDGGGGHNPVEAAQLGCAVLTGPNNQYQLQLYDDMRDSSAVIETKSEDELYQALHMLFDRPQTLVVQQNLSRQFAQKKAHVIDSITKDLLPLISRMEKRDAA